MSNHASHAEPLIVGVGMTTFGKHLERSLKDLAEEATASAMTDAEMTDWPGDQPVFFANAAGGSITGQEMIAGQVALAGTPLEGAPVINVENACASGGTALHLAVQAVARGACDQACVVGAEKLFHPDKLRSLAAIRGGTNLAEAATNAAEPRRSDRGTGSIMMAHYAAVARDYLTRSGADSEALAMVACKNRDHATLNSKAHFREPLSVEDVLSARTIADPLTLMMCSPISDGAAAVIVASASETEPSLHTATVLSSSLVSYRPQPGDHVVTRAAHTAFTETGLEASDFDLIELHDASAIAEILQYEEIGLAPTGKGHELLVRNETRLGGESPVNVSGGLLSRGHPLAATGCAQVIELVEQLRGRCGERQVPEASRGLAVNAGGWMGDDYAAAVATVLSRVEA